MMSYKLCALNDSNITKFISPAISTTELQHHNTKALQHFISVKRTLIFIITLIGLQSAMAQTNTPKYSNEFLAIGIDARAFGMSGAFTAISTGVTSAYWNPAGLVSSDYQYDASLLHANYFGGIANYDYAGFATKIDSISSMAVSVIRFAVDDIPDTRFLYDANGALNYDNIRFFSAADYAFLFSYARKMEILGGIDVGGNFKIVHRKVGNFANAWGYGLDFGAKKTFQTWGLGLMLRDLTGTFNAWSHNPELLVNIYAQTGNEIPENSIEVTLPKATLGVYKSFIYKEKYGLLLSFDFEASFDGRRNTLISGDPVSIAPKVGMEMSYDSQFFLRFGVGQFQELTDFDGSKYRTFQPNFGLGINLKNVSIDYALTDIGDQAESLYSHVISIKAGFNDKK